MHVRDAEWPIRRVAQAFSSFLLGFVFPGVFDFDPVVRF
jgi:hypothetical protein